ncbi:MAG: phytoene/squalene synthase family protein [Pseudomonadota bacterium]
MSVYAAFINPSSDGSDDRPDARAERLAAHGRETIAKGSKSFAMASLFFGEAMQADVQMLYAWCRHCDDVIDGQDLGGDAPDATLSPAEQARRLADLREKTLRALNGERTGEAAFDGFSLVARKCAIPARYPTDLLDGFSFDVERRDYATMADVMAYCYGVAGVVGVMMAIVMGVRSDDAATLDRACDLGLAFQLTNIARDVMDDARAGRVYLPADKLAERGVAADPAAVLASEARAGVAGVVGELLCEADRYYESAGYGFRRLSLRSAAAVGAARNVYRDIGRAVRAQGARAWDRRVIVSSRRKAVLAACGALVAAPQSLLPEFGAPPSRQGLWRRPADAPA